MRCNALALYVAGAGRSAGARSYEAAGAKLIGPRGGALVRGALVVLLFGSLVSLQIIIADLVQPIVETAVFHQHRSAPGDSRAAAAAAGTANVGNTTINATGGGGGESPWAFVASRGFITACSFAVVYPLTLARSVSALSGASSAAFVILLAVATTLVVRFVQAGAVIDPSVRLTNWEHPSGIALALPIVVSTTKPFECLPPMHRYPRPTHHAPSCAVGPRKRDSNIQHTAEAYA
jgi:amino acid permease